MSGKVNSLLSSTGVQFMTHSGVRRDNGIYGELHAKREEDFENKGNEREALI